jgi:preprotein translocase subunit SecG
MDILNKFLTVILFLNCLFLVLLVLVQLPKKEAGLGTAFGGGATDALFGAGAGNVLTKLTKWCAVLFLALCLLLSLDCMNPKELKVGEGPSDKSITNTGTKDAGTKDAGTKDAGTKDAGTKDAGTKDTNSSTLPASKEPKGKNGESSGVKKK